MYCLDEITYQSTIKRNKRCDARSCQLSVATFEVGGSFRTQHLTTSPQGIERVMFDKMLNIEAQINSIVVNTYQVVSIKKDSNTADIHVTGK